MIRKSSEFLTALVLYATILVYQGYQYGVGDQSQILPCLYAQDHPGVYAADHYVNAYLNSDINERTIFHFLLRYLGYNQPYVMLLWHLLLGTTLMMAWIRIAAQGIHQKIFQYLAVASIFILGFHTSTGSNELYYNMVIPSLAAKALGSWALYFWIKEEYNWWLGLTLIAGLLQPLVGIQLFLLTSIPLLIQLIIQHKVKTFPWKPTLGYLVITVPWMFLLASHNGGNQDPGAFMDIMEFRLSHHFFPSYFGWKNLFLFGLFVIITLRFYKERLRWMILLILAGCVLYTVGVEKYRLPEALYTQWWKTTIWLEAFAFIAIVVSFDKWNGVPKWMTRYTFAVPILLLVLISFYRLTGWFGSKPEYVMPWSHHVSDAIDISQQAEKVTAQDAVFIVPIDFTAFRWYSKRSLYVDYKAMLHQEKFLHEWYKRIENIYAYGLKEKKGGFDIHVFSTALLEEPSLISRDYWKSLGIGYIISTAHDIKSLELVARNDTYAIYKL